MIIPSHKRRNILEYNKVVGVRTKLECAIEYCCIETSKRERITYILTMGVHHRYSFHVAYYNCMEVPVTRSQSSTPGNVEQKAHRNLLFVDHDESLV